ncbi:hypothetical protein [Lysobacter enzymogenes]|uniref:Polymer-forming cytoskeletal protein n=1 Tax=Lysobacter enzymogenes TaxID=69 RepID=A0A3N2RNQ9_LYSEN|nr:hypothetical protein [Lysobacter enzymogenes]ROU09103.1 hypothetical protein D9T17_01515 [Lysobacter enzymogenes]
MTRTQLSACLSVLIALSSTAALADDDVSKVNGSITVEAGQRRGDVETVNGSIRVGDNAAVQDAQTVNGSITVGNGAQTGRLETVNGSIRAGTKLTASDGIETVNGGVFVDRGGRVRGDVETVNGSIGLVATELTGGIETVNGDVTVGVDSHVTGGIKYTKPTGNFTFHKRDPIVIVGPNARVDGPLVFERPVKLYVHSSAKTGAIRGATAIAFSGATPPAQ